LDEEGRVCGEVGRHLISENSSKSEEAGNAGVGESDLNVGNKRLRGWWVRDLRSRTSGGEGLEGVSNAFSSWYGVLGQKVVGDGTVTGHSADRSVGQEFSGDEVDGELLWGQRDVEFSVGEGEGNWVGSLVVETSCSSLDGGSDGQAVDVLQSKWRVQRRSDGNLNVIPEDVGERQQWLGGSGG